MKSDITPKRILDRKGWKILFLSLFAIIGVLVMQVVAYIAALILHLPEDGLAFTAVAHTVFAGSAALAMAALGGAAWLRPSKDDVKQMFRMGWPIIAADAALLLFAGIGLVHEGASIASGWLPNLAITALLCLCIGISEEVLYRGILFNAVLAIVGKSHRGTMAGVAIISLLFGLAHVSLTTDFASPFLALQAVLKIVQTGLFSVIMCSVVLRTHRLGGVSLLHGLSDFLLMVPTLVLMGGQLTTNYVSTGDEGWASIAIYLGIIALYLPFAIKAIRTMRRDRIAYRGVFMERAIAKDKDSQLPVAPMGQPDAA